MESGDEEPLIADVPALRSLLRKSSIDYQYTTQPEPRACHDNPKHNCEWPRGKVMGGSSVLNSMLHVRGSKFDYDNWANQGNPGWSWNDVLPYFKKSEDCRIPEVSSLNM